MNNPDHIFESLVTIFWIKILKFFDADPGSGMDKNVDPGSGMEKIRTISGIRNTAFCICLDPHLILHLHGSYVMWK